MVVSEREKEIDVQFFIKKKLFLRINYYYYISNIE